MDTQGLKTVFFEVSCSLGAGGLPRNTTTVVSPETPENKSGHPSLAKAKRTFAGSTIVLVALFVSACEKPGQTIGSIAGTAVGVVVGSTVGSGTGRRVATIVGGGLGTWIGSSAGKKLDEHDWELAENTTQETLEKSKTGETNTWSNPDSGNSMCWFHLS